MQEKSQIAAGIKFILLLLLIVSFIGCVGSPSSSKDSSLDGVIKQAKLTN